MSKILLTGSKSSGKTTLVQTLLGKELKDIKPTEKPESSFLKHKSFEFEIVEFPGRCDKPIDYQGLIFFFGADEVTDEKKLKLVKDYLHFCALQYFQNKLANVPILVCITKGDLPSVPSTDKINDLINFQAIGLENKLMIPCDLKNENYKNQISMGIKWILNTVRKNRKFSFSPENALSFFGNLVSKTNEKMNESFGKVFEFGAEKTENLMTFFVSDSKLPIFLISGIRDSGKTTLFKLLLTGKYEQTTRSKHPSFEICRNFNISDVKHSFKLFDVTTTEQKDIILNLQPHGMIFVINGCEKNSKKIELCQKKINEYLDTKDSKIPFLIVFNKSDLEKEYFGKEKLYEMYNINNILKKYEKKCFVIELSLLHKNLKDLNVLINAMGWLSLKVNENFNTHSTLPSTLFNDMFEEFKEEIKEISIGAKKLTKSMGENAKKIGEKTKQFGEKAKKVIGERSKELGQKGKEYGDWLVSETKTTVGWISSSLSSWWGGGEEEGEKKKEEEGEEKSKKEEEKEEEKKDSKEPKEEKKE